MNLKKTLFLVFAVCFFTTGRAFAATEDSAARRQAYLEQISPFFGTSNPERGKFSPLDLTWQDWQKRTRELPPDFENMPSITTLPDPLIIDEGGANIPVRTPVQWQEKKKWISEQIQHWVTGTIPPAPDNMVSKIISERKEGDVTLQMVEIRFGPDHRCKMGFELIIPPGEGPFPVFISQWSQRTWSLLAVRRGYIACLYRGSDENDDTDEYGDIYYPQYDFNRLMRRAWGASRVIDYLYTLPIVDKKCIGLTGHSRNGKTSLMAAAFDERIAAVIPCSGNTASENAFRYTTDNFNNETVEITIRSRPNWLSPRLRFFIGRTHKLPVDQNLLAAMIAPRGLMLSSATAEGAGNPWGIEQVYHSAKRVYEFLGAEDKIALSLRPGLHWIAARGMEDYIDFFDYVFGRNSRRPEDTLFFDYTFNKWMGLSGEKVDPLSFEPKGIDDLLLDAEGKKITSAAQWQNKKADIASRIRWGLGDEPPKAINPGPKVHTNIPYDGDDYLGEVIGRPRPTKNMARMPIAAGYGMGEINYGNLYYPTDDAGKPVSMKMPAVIYLHEYAYGTGFGPRFTSRVRGLIESGCAVLAYDQVGFGSRLDEAKFFYHRYPKWSRLGKMVSDLSSAVDTLENMDIIDKDRIYVMGYSLGATVALYGAAIDERIKGVVSVCGFTPMRLNPGEDGRGGIYIYSHLHGLAPKLGFFVDYEDRIPYDYHEIIATIAPRPALIIAPTWDRYADFNDVKNCFEQAKGVYELFGAADKLEFFAPEEYNRFSDKTRDKIWEWIPKNFK